MSRSAAKSPSPRPSPRKNGEREKKYAPRFRRRARCYSAAAFGHLRHGPSMLFRFLLAVAFVGLAGPALAHPHVWITMKSEVVVGPDGAVTAIRHHWAFDDMFSA